MYTSFNVKNFRNIVDDQEYYKIGKSQIERQKIQVQKNLSEIISNGTIDGDKLQKIWFPDEIFSDNPFVFMSHSHQDIDLVIKLAGFIYKNFSINSFIDSCVWGYCDDLKKELNDCTNGVCHTCNCGDFSYNQNCIDMMLSSSLMSVIDKSECMFFINTPSSINLQIKTTSPWIYYELNIANIIRKESHVVKYVNESCRELICKSIEFTPKLRDMKVLDDKKIKRWITEYHTIIERSLNPFALLYEIMGE